MSQQSRANLIDTSHEISKQLSAFYLKNPYGNRRYNGVTTALSKTKSEKDLEGLKKWRESIGEEKAEAIFQEAMSIGSSLDMIIESYLNSNYDKSKYINESGFKLFLQMQPVLDKIHPIGTQVHLYSDKYTLQGYLDCIGICNGKVTMIDFKNSRNLKKPEHIHDYFLQVTMYCMMLYDMTGILITDLKLIIAIRNNASRSQIVNAKLSDYVDEALDRINQFKVLKAKEKESKNAIKK